MKRQYITPSLFVVKLDMRSALMQISIDNSKVISSDRSEDVGFTKEQTDAGWNTNNNSIWDDEW